ncbi:zinc finger MYND domain-containing protein 11-like [Diadema antillarum]|uniref:zinc finger MYND domain-containing protein 11-like n=1 Tax=Diadema antillarum TaxID=105358 RepID=UPI003A88D08E
MVKTVKRRMSDPQVILQLWEAITFIRQQRQVANMERIVAFMSKHYSCSAKETQRQIVHAVKENLLVKELSKSKVGSRAGTTQDGFWCAEERTEESEEPHDWYCFKCHKGGEVLCCGTCYRVYHPECVNVEPEKVLSLWICPYCEACRKKSVSTSKWELNKILHHVINRMKDKSRDLTKKLNLNELPNYYNLVYHHVDLATMMQKLTEKKYRSIEEFQGDADAMTHVAAIYYGTDSDRFRLCMLILEDCLYDLSEIRLCKDCYIMSNDRTQHDWFCKPCNPPHELVWAQMTGFGYWPAKVLQKNQDKVDVRFFGSRHQRAWIEKVHVVDIDTDRKNLRIKVTQGWRSAVDEMQKYQDACKAVKQKGGTKEEGPSSGRKRKTKDKTAERLNKKAKGVSSGEGEENDDEEEEDSMEGTADSVEEGEDKEDDQSEARHVVKLSSTTDAGQDHSVSTSQTSPEGVDEPQVKKQKLETPATTMQSETPDEVKEEEMDDAEPEENTPSPAVDEGECDDKNTVSDEDTAVSELRAKLEADFKKKLDRAVREAVEKAKLEWQAEKEKLLKEAKEKLAAEVQRAKNETDQKCKKDYSEQIQKLTDEISQTKKKQWCINCEKEAMYHCCWNTSYCSISCQQVHWHQEHKRLCRRKR